MLSRVVLSPALDAYCLLQVYDVLQHKIESYQLNVDCRPSKEGAFVKTSTRSQKKHKRATERKMKPADLAHKTVSALIVLSWLVCLCEV